MRRSVSRPAAKPFEAVEELPRLAELGVARVTGVEDTAGVVQRFAHRTAQPSRFADSARTGVCPGLGRGVVDEPADPRSVPVDPPSDCPPHYHREDHHHTDQHEKGGNARPQHECDGLRAVGGE
ncbi:hypothetical protein ACU686_17780 [Yinghuangia aomiensis]